MFHATPELATPTECQTVIAAYDRIQPQGSISVGIPLWDWKVVYQNAFSRLAPEAAAVMATWRERSLAIVAATAGAPVYSDALTVVRWNVGDELQPHYDDRNMDGSPNATSWREWAGVIYLNDEFEGGEIHLPELFVMHRPQVGEFVHFPASALHGVKRVQGARRYTAAQWFSRDPGRENR